MASPSGPPGASVDRAEAHATAEARANLFAGAHTDADVIRTQGELERRVAAR